MITRHQLLGFLAFLIGSGSAQAHFQMLQTDQYLRDKGGKIILSMPFTHPSQGGPMMAMQEPYSLVMHHKGRQTDLTDEATVLTWQGVENKAQAFQSEAKLRGLGDYIFTLTPAPYLEESEDAYIQPVSYTHLTLPTILLV